jgi:hypothetical protein
MAYCTTSELVNLTGTTKSATVQGAIIDAADREIGAYLGASGITGSACDALKEASLKLSQAGLLNLRVQEGEYIQSSGEFVSGVDATAATDITNAARALRKDAFALLDNYIAAQSTSPGSVRVSRVRSRCH